MNRLAKANTPKQRTMSMMKTASIYISLIVLAFLMCGNIKAQCPAAAPGHHKVQKGETLYRISKNYKVSIDQICAWNGITKTSILKVCQDLVIAPPQSSTPASTIPSSPAAPKTFYPTQGGTHRIKPGETIAGLAELYGYTETKFREINGLSPTEPAWPGLYLKTSDCNCPSPNEAELDPVYVDANTKNKDVPTEASFDPSAQIPSWKEAMAANEENQEQKIDNPFGEDPFTGAPAVPAPSARKKPTTDGASAPTLYNEGQKRITAPNTPKETTAQPSVDPKVKRSTSGQQAPSKTYVSPEEELIRRNRKDTNTSSTNPETKTDINPLSSANSSKLSVTKDAARYMTAEEIAMVNEINLIRSNPAGYIKYIQEYKKEIGDGRGFGSVATCNELIAELRLTPPLSILEPAECIYRAAKKHGLDQKPTGSTDHVGTDGSYPWDRVRRECSTMSDGNENIVGGPADVRKSVILLLVDDGIPNRGHRRTLLDKSWKYVACYKIGTVGSMPNSWIQKFGK